MHTHAYTHIYIYIYINTHTHTHIHIYTHTYTYIHAYMHTYTHTHIHIYIYINTHTHTYTYIHTHIYIHTCMHAYLHTHTHTHTHTYTHTFTRHTTSNETSCVTHVKVVQILVVCRFGCVWLLPPELVDLQPSVQGVVLSPDLRFHRGFVEVHRNLEDTRDQAGRNNVGKRGGGTARSVGTRSLLRIQSGRYCHSLPSSYDPGDIITFIMMYCL